jgi:hypothetical protein
LNDPFNALAKLNLNQSVLGPPMQFLNLDRWDQQQCKGKISSSCNLSVGAARSTRNHEKNEEKE